MTLRFDRACGVYLLANDAVERWLIACAREPAELQPDAARDRDSLRRSPPDRHGDLRSAWFQLWPSPSLADLDLLSNRFLGGP